MKIMSACLKECKENCKEKCREKKIKEGLFIIREGVIDILRGLDLIVEALEIETNESFPG